MKKYIKASTDWSTILSELESDGDDGIVDPIYEGTEAGQAITDLCQAVESELNIELVPSVQAGQGTIEIYDNSDNLIATDIDFADFNDETIELAFKCNSAEEFKQDYRNMIRRYIDEH